ncbi:MAG: CoA pyrophosphatase [Rhodocyclaceae bacterium]|nr:CoA pyrophosphatase [Rhodocyclaceae bacterium]MDZ4215620.1 CoA pyrophosphatase [Rhodocyclaceae bacterium]
MELTADWLRERCLSLHPVPPVQESSKEGVAMAAAVLIPVVDRPSGLTVLLTQRTAHLRDHAGQISFPGGRCEPTDCNAVDTALRESREEVGILPEQVSVLAVLPEYWTSTGFRVTPVLGLVTPPLNLQLDDFEVAEVFEPPLAFFLDATNYRREAREYQGQLRHYWAVPWRNYFIWGATAGMFVNLRQSLLGPDHAGT